MSDLWMTTATEKTAALRTAQDQVENHPDYDFSSVSASSIDDRLVYAVCEQALFLLMAGDGADRRAALRAMGVRSASLIGESFSARGTKDVTLAPTAREFLVDYRRYGKGFKFTA